ncbi:GIY-YIG nuclease family protein [Demequina rhizosphaerae]|uniref:GIY-YIG nuclease family protein n=1 Tax=Demequina rhizosphaerae TaxID=1638985 RepID=UPI000781F3E8|nr:GIY-YIG nuclease family protein [Demequina rhizosphaerae]
MPNGEARFWVYVIELDSTGLVSVGENGAVYVGETSLTPAVRYDKHKAGGKSSARVVFRRGVRLRPDLFPPEGPFETRREALRFERRTKNRLEHRGYRVFGGQGETFMKGASRAPDA